MPPPPIGGDGAAHSRFDEAGSFSVGALGSKVSEVKWRCGGYLYYLFLIFAWINRIQMIDFPNVKIAVDFDGTIVEHEYPEIGREKLFAFQTLKELEKMGARLILWTFRTGKELDEAVEYCRKNGIEFYAVNKNYPEEIFDDTVSRKIDADSYIDDKNVGGFPGWSEVWQILVPFEIHEKEAERRIAAARINKIKRFFGRKDKPDESK